MWCLGVEYRRVLLFGNRRVLLCLFEDRVGWNSSALWERWMSMIEVPALLLRAMILLAEDGPSVLCTNTEIKLGSVFVR